MALALLKVLLYTIILIVSISAVSIPIALLMICIDEKEIIKKVLRKLRRKK